MSAASVKPTALILLPEAPYPAIGGGPLRTASIIEFLAAKYELEAIHFRLAGDADPAESYPKGYLVASHALELPHHSKKFWPKLRRNAWRGWRGIPPLVDRFSGFDQQVRAIVGERRFDLIWIEHFWAAPYGEALKANARKLVLDLHNVESQYFASMAVDAPALHKPLLERFSRCALEMERRLLPGFDLVVTTSEEDRRRVGGKSSAVVPNTIPWQKMPDVVKSESIVFSGNFAYQPNQQGLAWFLAGSWPEIRKARPGCRLRLVGREIEFARLVAGGAESIDFIGPVEDAVVSIAESRVAIVPLLAGSGTRLKIVEAWAAGTPVVSTRIGAEGLAAVQDEEIKIADGEGEFAQSVLDLFDNEGASSRLARGARLLYETRHTWQTARDILSELDL